MSSPSQKERHLVNPTILLIEDNVNYLARIAREFTSNTALGVLPLGSLKEALNYISPAQMKRYHVKSVFADQEFSEDTQSRRIHTGLALLRLVKRRQPNIGLYLHTVHGEDENILKSAEQTLGSRSRIFPKGERRKHGQEPWDCVWRDWLLQALRADSTLQNALEAGHINALEAIESSVSGDERMAEKIRQLFDAHRVTYLYLMGPAGQSSKLCFKKPVQIVCVREGDGSFTARALGLGILKDGQDNNNAWDAQVQLADHIAEFYLDLQATNPSKLGTFARQVLNNLNEIVRPCED